MTTPRDTFSKIETAAIDAVETRVPALSDAREITKLKLVKRLMYGRRKLDLLVARLLGHAT